MNKILQTVNKTAFKLIIMQLSIVFLVLLLPITKAESTPATKILVWGDSLSAAYGIPVEKGWVALLQNQLAKDVSVVNASISGETTQGGLTRLPKALETHKPDILLLELGANDGLRGINTKIMRRNLQAMIEMAQAQNTTVILLGIKIPPNYGRAYTQQFENVFSDLAEEYHLGFVPFILEGIATDFDLMLADGIHPNAEAQSILLDNVLPAIKSELVKDSKLVSTEK